MQANEIGPKQPYRTKEKKTEKQKDEEAKRQRDNGKDNGNDDVWTVLSKRVPPVGTPVTVVLAPFSQPKIQSK